VLRVILKPEDRDTITGDLLEEYRETIAPARGTFRAGLWYLKQVLSLLATTSNPSVRAAMWLAGAGVVIATLMLRLYWGPPSGLRWIPFALVLRWIPFALAVNAVTSLRHSDVRLLWRVGIASGVLFSLAMMLSVCFAVLAPLEDAHHVIMAYEGPRGFLLVGAGGAIFVAAGFLGASKGNRAGAGTLAAMITSVVGAIITMVLVYFIKKLSPTIQDQLGPIGTFAQPNHFAVRGDIMVMLLMLSSVPGTIGAFFGRGIGGHRRQGAAAA
jgi:hypothetical protein